MLTETKAPTGKPNTQNEIKVYEGKWDHMRHLKVCEKKLKITFPTHNCFLVAGV